MKTKLKQMGTSFALMIIFYIIFSSPVLSKLGLLDSHIGLLFILGLLYGPYGTLGAVLGNITVELYSGFPHALIIVSAIFSFGVSYLAYKLWYLGYKDNKVTKPRLVNINQLILFLLGIFICGFIYSAIQGNLMAIIISEKMENYTFVSDYLNFINIAFIFGIISIWISKKIDFIETPKPSKKKVNEKLYKLIFYLFIVSALISIISIATALDKNIISANIILMGILLFAYLTKPFKKEIQSTDENTIIENIINNFLILIIAIVIFGVIISIIGYGFVESIPNLNKYVSLMPTLIITDIVIALFLIPGIIILKYIENKVLQPISAFSEIERFIKEDEKIESEGLAKVYSKYINEQNEIGTLARSYTDLINHNNHYIENIREIEGEKERINAELDIATKIQASILPTKPIETTDFIVNGYSKPTKEVGGDFFDYYKLDGDNLVIMIGDASGKGIPAALVAMITQFMTKQILKNERDPSKVLYSLNNQLSENNPELMFLTLWLGIYNTTTKKLTFSNAGHNPPLINEKGEFKYLDIDSGIVLGITEEFDYVLEETTLTDELVLYTDGITDANNSNYKMYGEDRLLSFFNEFNSNANPINSLLNDIDEFVGDAKQFDDITLLYLKIK